MENKVQEFNVKMDITFEKELAFAQEFYTQAIIGLDKEDYPPKPLDWLEDWKKYEEGWTFYKVQLMAEENEENKDQLKDFLRCTLCVYCDFMCQLGHLMEKENLELIDEISKDKEEVADLEYMQFPLDQSM
jgi:hypothetical protein